MTCPDRSDHFALVALVLAALLAACGGTTGPDGSDDGDNGSDGSANQAPSASIISPSSDTTVNEGEQVSFEGSADDPEDGTLTGSSLEWTSDVDGALGTGEAVATTLSAGATHQVILTTTDSDGAIAEDTVAVTVGGTNEAPSVQIGAPSQDSTVAEGDSVTFEGSADDPEDGTLTGSSLEWTSDVDGALGTGETVTTTLSAGATHQVILTATDSDGAIAEDTVAVTVGGTGSVSFGDTIQGTIESSGDIDEFTFSGSAGQEVAVYLQGRTGNFLDDFELQLLDPSGVQVGNTVNSNGADDSLLDEDHTGRVELQVSGTYTVRVSGDPGDYRILVHLVDRAPEDVPASIALGDTVSGEALDLPTDIDEFTFSGSAGQEVTVFLQGLTGSGDDDFELRLLDPSGVQVGNTVNSDGADDSLLDDGTLQDHEDTGRVELQVSGTYTVRVLGGGPFELDDRGSYRFFAHLVDRAPEDVPAGIALGDTVSGEALEPPTDIDEFTFSGSAGQEVTVFLQGLTGSSDDLFELQLLDPSGVQQVGNSANSNGADDSLLDGNHTGRLQLPESGTYTVRVLGGGHNDAGSYRFFGHLVDRAPEDVPASITLGDTVSGEALGPPTDIDEFTFSGSAGQEVTVFLQGLTGSGGDDFELQLLDPSGVQVGNTVNSNGADDSLLDGDHTGLVQLPESGTYTVRVLGRFDDDAGSYRFFAHLVDRAPEDVPAGIALGDTVSGEALEPPTDIDEFTFSGSAGQEVTVFLQGLTGSGGDDFELQLLDPGGVQVGNTVNSNGADDSLLDGDHTGRVQLPESGTYTVRVLGRFDDDAGSYRFFAHLVDRAPEDVPAGIALGDTVSGEALEPPTDIDEFTFSGSAGQEVEALLQGRTGSNDDDFELQLLDPGGSQLASVSSDGADSSFQSTGSVTLPESGTYTVRVLGRDNDDAGSYRFLVRSP